MPPHPRELARYQIGATHIARFVRLAPISLLLAGLLALVLGSSPHRGSAATACLPGGQVLDHLGQPVPGIHLRLSRGPELINLATDSDGRYDFANTTAALSNDAFADSPLSLELILERYDGFSPRFQIFHRQQLPSARVAIEPTAEGCDHDFDFRSPLSSEVAASPAEADWPALIQLFQHTQRAWELLESLDLADQAPPPPSTQAATTPRSPAPPPTPTRQATSPASSSASATPSSSSANSRARSITSTPPTTASTTKSATSPSTCSPMAASRSTRRTPTTAVTTATPPPPIPGSKASPRSSR